jgi:cholesterol transport system auxiliary component
MKVILPAIILLLSGCTVTPHANAPLAVYSLGVLHMPDAHDSIGQSATGTPSLLIADATAPVWLDSQAIQYRLAYHNPTRLYTYANSRWAATPAAMLTLQVRNRLLSEANHPVIKPGDGAQADYTLQIDLIEFTQFFSSADSSHAEINLNASLIKRKTRTLFAQQNFSMRQKTATADAAGAVNAFTEASDKLTEHIVGWIAKEISGRAQ